MLILLKLPVSSAYKVGTLLISPRCCLLTCSRRLFVMQTVIFMQICIMHIIEGTRFMCYTHSPSPFYIPARRGYIGNILGVQKRAANLVHAVGLHIYRVVQKNDLFI